MCEALTLMGDERSQSPSHAPRADPTVHRERLLAPLLRERPDIAVIAAPAGYGKTTLLEQWAAVDGRPLVWCAVEISDNDPGRLSTTLEASIAQHDAPAMVVLDDVHLLTARAVLDEVKVLAGRLPEGSTLVLSGRSVPDLLLGMTRTRRRVIDIGLARLAFDADEVAEICRSRGLEPSPTEVDLLMRHTEGWPAAVRLGVNGALVDDDPLRFLTEFGGDDRDIVEVLGEVLLDTLPDDLVQFAIAVSPLERMSGPLCDAVLGRTGSASALEQLGRHTTLLIPLDRKRTWYRFHRMLHQLLRAEHRLRPDQPLTDAVTKQRASVWFEQHGDVDTAIELAALAQDSVRATELVLEHFSASASRGNPKAVEAWLHTLTEVRVPSNPALEAVAGLVRMGLGDPQGCVRSMHRAAFALPEPHPVDGPFEQAAACVAAIRASLGTQSADAMLTDARYARRHTGSPVWYSIASLGEGAAEFMVGDVDAAYEVLQISVAQAETRSFTTLACAYAHLAIIADHRGAPAEALGLARQAKQVVAEYGLDATPQVFLAQIVSALFELRAGKDVAALADRAAGLRNMQRAAGLGPWAHLQALVALAGIDRLRGDSTGKLEWLAQADALLERVPDALLVKDQIAEQRRLGTPKHSLVSGSITSLSSAELKVLRYLPTHLTLSEIADKLYLSRHTVKSHVMSMYRKLGTSTRNDTVEVARTAGLLVDPPPTTARSTQP